MATLVAAVLLTACANRGIGPQGGPKDESAPEVRAELPVSGTTNFSGKRVEITFNEYIQLDRVSENVLISPASKRQPEIKARGKKVQVNFVDSLLPNTTYSLSFGRAICDFHEKNPILDYAYVFSTGPEIDTLEVAGLVVHAHTLNPVAGAIAGIHANHSDTALAKCAFTQIAKTDSAGIFYIHGVHEGHYRLYALVDGSRDYRYQPGEPLAVYADHLTVTPAQADAEAIPVLYLYEEDFQRCFMSRPKRPEPHRIDLPFSYHLDSLPQLQADWLERAHIVRTNNIEGADTLTCWLRDSLDIARDTLPLVITYLKSDSLYHLVPQCDTLTLAYRAPTMTERARRKAAEKAAKRAVQILCNASERMLPTDTLSIRYDYPIAAIDSAKIHIYPDSLLIDSAAVTDIYGHVNHRFFRKIKRRSREEFSTLRVKFTNLDEPYVVELLDEKDAVIRIQAAKGGEIYFDYLEPKNYYMRVIHDTDRNGRWTTGSYLDARQPEQVTYFPHRLNLKANWDFEEIFDPSALDPLDSKPEDLIKIWTPKKN